MECNVCMSLSTGVLSCLHPSANLPRCVMPFGTHANSFSLYIIMVTSHKMYVISNHLWIIREKHQCSALLPICEGNTLVIGGIPQQLHKVHWSSVWYFLCKSACIGPEGKHCFQVTFFWRTSLTATHTVCGKMEIRTRCEIGIILIHVMITRRKSHQKYWPR